MCTEPEPIENSSVVVSRHSLAVLTTFRFCTHSLGPDGNTSEEWK